ncbi:MAG: phytoene desaturase family protein [Burkholderiaceae bacterium]
MATYDAVIVGSGINSLACAASLARRGRSVCVLEREKVLGGCIRTDELTAPGYLHDTLSAAHPLFVTGPAHAELGDELRAHGLSYCNNDTPTGVLLPDGRHLLLSTSRDQNVRRFEALAEGDGQAYQAALQQIGDNAGLIFALLGGELWSAATLRALLRHGWRTGPRASAAFFGDGVQSGRAWLSTAFRSDLLRALLAPWVLHCGLTPDSAMSGLMLKVIAFTLEAVGMPMVEGGNARTVEVFRRLIEQYGGCLHTEADVERVLTRDGSAVGVRLADGREFGGRHVICNVTPGQLYGRLLGEHDAPAEIRRQAVAYRHGKGNLQIHLALSEPVQWCAPELSTAVYVHLSDGVDAVARACDEAQRGLLPAEGTICVGQPSAIDPSRAPTGGSVLWVQVPECPSRIAGDALGRIEAPADGQWSVAVREAYADRIIERMCRQMPNLARAIVGRAVISPTDLSRMNINLVGGDPYGGECSLDQFLLWRPLKGTRNHATPVRKLWHIGASTHPGPGLSGASGMHVARRLARG